MADIFISYSRDDRQWVANFADRLREQGWSVFWDRDIPTGHDFRDVIGNNLSQAKCVVVVWSRHSVRSHWVIDEADEAARRHVIHPILIDDVEIPLGLRRYQPVRLIDWKGAALDPELERSLTDIAKVIGQGPRESPKLAGRGWRLRIREHRIALAVAAAMLGVAIVGGATMLRKRGGSQVSRWPCSQPGAFKRRDSVRVAVARYDSPSDEKRGEQASDRVVQQLQLFNYEGYKSDARDPLVFEVVAVDDVLRGHYDAQKCAEAIGAHAVLWGEVKSGKIGQTFESHVTARDPKTWVYFGSRLDLSSVADIDLNAGELQPWHLGAAIAAFTRGYLDAVDKLLAPPPEPPSPTTGAGGPRLDAPSRAYATAYRAAALVGLGRYRKADAVLNELPSPANPLPQDVDWQLKMLRGLVSDARGDIRASLHAYQQAIDVNDFGTPGYWQAQISAWNEQLRLGEVDRVLRETEALIHKYRDNLCENGPCDDIVGNKINALIGLNRGDDALSCARAWRNHKPRSRVTHAATANLSQVFNDPSCDVVHAMAADLEQTGTILLVMSGMDEESRHLPRGLFDDRARKARMAKVSPFQRGSVACSDAFFALISHEWKLAAQLADDAAGYFREDDAPYLDAESKLIKVVALTHAGNLREAEILLAGALPTLKTLGSDNPLYAFWTDYARSLKRQEASIRRQFPLPVAALPTYERCGP